MCAFINIRRSSTSIASHPDDIVDPRDPSDHRRLSAAVPVSVAAVALPTILQSTATGSTVSWDPAANNDDN